jgi:TM2 domain-containing membrane protein YozV
MNCVQHADTAAVAYCRTCGKALCETCKRDVQGTIFCESCLAARVHGSASGNFEAAAGGNYPPRRPEDASPGLALFLGFIPGVGAFYNGQFLKGFVHVMVFSTLIWLSDHGMGGFAGMLIAAWFFYMVFDAYTTAKARRYGLPIPDPLGLNAILEGRDGTFRQRVEQAGERLGTQVEYAAHNVGQHWQRAGGVAPGGTASNVAPPPTGTPGEPVQGVNPGAQNGVPYGAPGAPYTDPQQGTYYSGPQGTYYAGPGGAPYAVPPPDYVPPKERERNPVGAIVLIGFGLLLLLANLGWFNFNWVSHFWPLILIAVGVWLVVKRQCNAR